MNWGAGILEKWNRDWRWGCALTVSGEGGGKTRREAGYYRGSVGKANIASHCEKDDAYRPADIGIRGN